MYLLLADLTVLLHFAFVAFAIGGGLLVPRWPRLAWLHLPTAAWAAAVELMDWACPLTPLENRLRTLAGQAGGANDFVGHRLLPLLYPEGLTREVQLTLGALVVAINLYAYARVLARRRRR